MGSPTFATEVSSSSLDAVLLGHSGSVSGEDLEALLQWTAAPAGVSGARVSARLQTLRIGEGPARRRTLALLDRMLFARSDATPHRVLGLEPSASSAVLRDRYRLLMRIYHPDRATRDPMWLHERAARINDAYRRCREPFLAKAVRPIGAMARPATRPPRGSRRLRRRSRHRPGSARTVRLHAILALAGICATWILYAFVANRAWEDPPSRQATTDFVGRSP
jgi:hypothetical protein